jgi:electron transfer flavoprotein alpha subunit
MKTLIIGEVVDNKLSTGALEIVTKANDLGLDYEIVTVGSEESPNIGSESFKNTYMKCSENKLSLGSVADKLKNIIEENTISLVLAPSTYVGRDLIAFLSVDFKSSQVSNVINFEIEGESVITSNSINGGESEYNSKISSPNKFLLIRPKSFEEAALDLNTNYETVEITSEDPEVFDIFIEEKTGPQLEDSKIVISAGRGM